MTSALPQEAMAMAGPLAGIMGRMGGLMFGAQVGQAFGRLAGEVLTGTEVGLPLAPDGTAVLVPLNVAALAAGLERAAHAVRPLLAPGGRAPLRLLLHALRPRRPLPRV